MGMTQRFLNAICFFVLYKFFVCSLITFTFASGVLDVVDFVVSRCGCCNCCCDCCCCCCGCGPASVVIVVVASTLILFVFVSHLSGAFGWPSSDGAILDLLIDDIDTTMKTGDGEATAARSYRTTYAKMQKKNANGQREKLLANSKETQPPEPRMADFGVNLFHTVFRFFVLCSFSVHHHRPRWHNAHRNQEPPPRPPLWRLE